MMADPAKTHAVAWGAKVPILVDHPLRAWDGLMSQAAGQG